MLRRKDFAKDIASPLNTMRYSNHRYSFVIYLKENNVQNLSILI